MFKVIVAGSRDFSDYELLKHSLNYLLSNAPEPVEIVSGTANGADKLGECYAKELNLPVTRFPAKWTEYGRRAGYLRNKQMAEYADALVAFWNGISPGTRSMIALAEEHNLKVRVIHYNQTPP